MSKAEEIKKQRVEALLEDPLLHFIQFKGASMMRTNNTKGYVPLTSDNFSRLAYERFEGISKNGIEDLLHAVRIKAKDRSDLARYIAFGDKIWDMEKLEFTDDTLDWVYASDIKPAEPGSKGYEAAFQFLLELATGDETLAYDYLQSLAPIAMTRKPSGVIWFVGSGSNGKSALINALYMILGRYFASLTTSSIEDGRDAPRLNGILGNICRESSESRVEDTERYKAIGTHEPFAVHKFRTQDMIEVVPDFHTIFNANNIPVFSDKTKGARRRTLILPFNAHFKDDPTFEERTFTTDFLGGMLTLILETTMKMREQGYRYEWGDATLRAKESYDSDVNSVEAYLEYLKDSGIVGFYNYAMLKVNYEMWCSHHGYVPLGMTTLKRTMSNEVGATRKAIRTKNIKTGDNTVVQRYQFAEVIDDELVWLDNGYGLRNKEDAKIAEKVEARQRKLSPDWE